MRLGRLLKVSARENGEAMIGFVGSLLFLVVLALGVTQVALSLFVRNAVLASAHEGARAAVERGGTDAEAEAWAATVVRRSAGRSVKGLTVRATAAGELVEVRVTASIAPLGPIPFPMKVSAVASARRSVEVP